MCINACSGTNGYNKTGRWRHVPPRGVAAAEPIGMAHMGDGKEEQVRDNEIPSVRRVSRRQRSPVRIFLILSASVLLSGILAQQTLRLFALPTAAAIVLNLALQIFLLLPIFHLFFFRILVHYIVEFGRSTADLQDNAARLAAIVDTVFDGIVVIDERGIIRDANPATAKIFGFAVAEMIGQKVNLLMPEPYRSQHDRYLANYLRTGETKIIGIGRELIGQRKNGEIFPIELAVTEMYLHGERKFVGTILDISKRKEAEELLRRTNEALEQRVQQRTSELAKMNLDLSSEIAERKLIEKKLELQARTDDLTGVCNRRQFDVALEMELERVRRYHSTPLLIMFDIDHFKQINDVYGHQQGDAILKELARLVSQEIRVNDIFARWGGEEFILIVFENDLDGARLIAEKLKAAIEGHAFPRVGHITCSFGVTACGAEDDASALMSRVDKLMYLAKERGRNRVEVQ